MVKGISRRDLIRAAAAVGAVAPFLRPTTLLAQPADDYISRYVHPELQAMARQAMGFGANSSPTLATLPAMRKGMAAYARPRLADVPVERRIVPGRAGQPPVAVYVINAKPGQSRPGILHTHGGGFIIGTAEAAIGDMQPIARDLDCTVVTVDYRLAPETTYAGAIEDIYTGLTWLHANAAALGVDPARIAVMGESAGGGLAALLAITARDRSEVPLAFQCLVYPMLDDRTGSSRRAPDHVGHLIWTPAANHFGWRSFLGMEPGTDRVPPRAVPARTASLAGLPPAFIGVGAIDLFHDEDVDYAQRLNDAGVPAELIVVPGAFHGFDGFPAPISQWFTAAKLEALRRGLGLKAA